jgi:hypothetical protein
MKKKFNPQQWLNNKVNDEMGFASPTLREAPISIETPRQPKDLSNIEQVIRQIESMQIDITSNYADWRNLGFAFAEEFGESGRYLFHRVSRFYPEYKPTECDKQFDACLKATGHGITIKTFFYLAKQAGIEISHHAGSAGPFSPLGETPVYRERGREMAEGRRGPAHISADHPSEELPTFPASIFPHLPAFLQKILEVSSSDEERDILLLGSLTALSACIPNVYGIYDGKKVYPNLYLFISAQASAGKGRLVHCRQLVKPIHKMLRQQAKLLKQQYEMEMAEFNASKKNKNSRVEKPEKPQEKMLFIPANNSTTGVFQLLSDNDGRGLIFETEGDTLAQAFKSDYGNYSDGFRKAFHHETISYYRRTDREYVDIESPCLSTVLSGTPGQIASLIPSAENGLFSRFIFYFMNIKPVWKNVFETSATHGLDDYFTSLGNEYIELYNSLLTIPEMEFILSPRQQQQFNSFFEQIQTTWLTFQGIDYMATIRRLGLIAFRMAMVMSVLRIPETGEFPEQQTCTDQDLNTIFSLIKILVQHSSRVFSELPEEPKPARRQNRKEKFLSQLPATFNRQIYLQVANSLSIPDKTAEAYITEFVKKHLIHRESQDHYINTFHEKQNNSSPPVPEVPPVTLIPLK